MMQTRSLQRDLNRWVILTATVFVLVGGTIAGGGAFYEARELQDNLLREVAVRVRAGQLSSEPVQSSEAEEETIVISRLGPENGTLGARLDDSLRTGLQTVSLDGERWRIFVVRQERSGAGFVVAQQTELRDEIALNSALNVFLPVLLLSGAMLLTIHFLIRHHLRPLSKLAARLDRQNAMQLESLPATGIPQELLPFTTSINALLVRLREAMREQSRFIADAAHELRTPVAALSLQVENLQAATSAADRKARQLALQEGLERLRLLVSRLLDLARLQAEPGTPPQPVSFHAVVRGVIAELHPLAESAHVDLGVTTYAEVKVLDQDGQLTQLVRNAIDNAIRYTPAGGRVDVSLAVEEGKAVFSVEDTGPGIEESLLEHVMEPFFRIEGSRQTGSGLGLAISRQIAERLDGTITLSNQPGGGLRFTYFQAVCHDLPITTEPSSDT